MLPSLKEILAKTDVKALRRDLVTWEEHLRKHKEDLDDTHTHDLHDAWEKYIEEIENMIASVKSIVLSAEKEKGCDICGAQAGEDCRLFNENGCCEFYEEAKESGTI